MNFTQQFLSQPICQQEAQITGQIEYLQIMARVGGEDTAAKIASLKRRAQKHGLFSRCPSAAQQEFDRRWREWECGWGNNTQSAWDALTDKEQKDSARYLWQRAVGDNRKPGHPGSGRPLDVEKALEKAMK